MCEIRLFLSALRLSFQFDQLMYLVTYGIINTNSNLWNFISVTIFSVDLLFVDNAELYRTASGRQDVAGAEWKENAMQVIRKQTLGGNGKQKCFYVAKDANRHLSQLSMGSAMFFNSFCDRSGISPARVQLSSECFQFLKYD